MYMSHSVPFLKGVIPVITAPDFDKKQIVFVFAKEGERLRLKNGNIVVLDANEKVKLQVSCYRLFIVYIVGHLSITTSVIEQAKKFGFFFALFSPTFRLNDLIGAHKDGNTLLKEKQYLYHDLEIAKHLVKNKIYAQIALLNEQRMKSEYTKKTIQTLKEYYSQIDNQTDRHSIMAYEGLSSKIYFRAHFNNLPWQGRQPRIKKDWINSALDIGYTVLFSFVESLLCAFGFDTYIGVLHTQFYMRKSLTCDLVEPFRPMIDKTVKVCYNLKEMKESDFIVVNHQYRLSWQQSPKYISLFMKTILENKKEVFSYIQQYYRCFMRNADINEYPFYKKGEKLGGFNQL